jgi:hypothetical protein
VSDHLDAPGLKSPNMDVRVDITDISAFQNLADPTRSFLAMSLFTGVRGIGILRTSRRHGPTRFLPIFYRGFAPV